MHLTDDIPLTKVEKKILKHIQEHPDKKVFFANDIAKSIGTTNREACSACRRLAKNGFLDYAKGYDDTLMIGPSHDGLNYKELSKKQSESYFFKSVIVPIGVSAITAFITSILTLALKGLL